MHDLTLPSLVFMCVKQYIHSQELLKQPYMYIIAILFLGLAYL